MSLHLSALHVYPIKSCAPLSPDAADVEPRGLAGDRRWMIVDERGRFITGREQPRLTLIRAEPLGAGLRMTADGFGSHEVPAPDAEGARLRVVVWRSEVDALLADAAGHDWISRFLGKPCRLVYMDERARRPVEAQYAEPGDEVSFADGFPLLLIGSGSLDGLNARLAAPVSMLRFRPNLVVTGAAAHAEDGWKRIRVGALEFDVVKPCTRCVFTTVVPERGELDRSGEPLRTLKTYRRTPFGVAFGQNLIARRSGVLEIGDAVEVLA